MLKLDMFNSPSITVQLEQVELFLAPSFDTQLPQEQTLDGTLHLILPKPRFVSRIVAKLIGVTSYATRVLPAGGTSTEEPERTLEKEIEIKLGSGKEGELLEKGEHVFSFTFLVPSNAAPYQRSEYGSTRHFIVASVEGCGFSKPLQSPLRSVYFIALPSLDPSSELRSFASNDSIDVFDERLGPVSVNFFSPHLTVASLLSISLSIPSPLTSLIIKSITSVIFQTYTITYPSGETLTFPPRRHILSSSDSTTHLAAGQAWSNSSLARLLHEDVLRPTTLEESNTTIRVSHKLGLDVRYQAHNEPQHDHIFKVAKPAFITSCSCHVQSMNLPLYSLAPPPLLKVKKLPPCYCVCSASFKELADDPLMKEAMKLKLSIDASASGMGGRELLPATVRERKSPVMGTSLLF